MSVIVICIVVFILWKIVTNDDSGNIPPAGSDASPPPYNPDFIPPAGTAPPPYGASHRRHGRSQGWRPGFFSGFGAGWFGNNWWNRPAGYTRHRSTHTNQTAYNQGYSDGAQNSSPKR